MNKRTCKMVSVGLALLLLGANPLWAQDRQQALRTKLESFINSETRSESLRARNQYRNPLETLLFFEVSENDQVLVEIWPGGQGGWYRSILEPFFATGTGTYIPVMDSSPFPDPVAEVPDGTADRVLVFRAHGFMIYEHPAQAYFDAIYRMLKPGGIFGIVDHRGDENIPQDPVAENGYVNQSHVLELARRAGFTLVESAEINANPLDTKDYPDGVYSLPPTLRGSLLNRSLRARVLEIGESDRMTLKFVK
ncbi:MAG: methyltransferase [Pseudomonadales bacterium]|nr:methyltransferase [Pseudomonadales bacterium]